jgi:hypothetical protein
LVVGLNQHHHLLRNDGCFEQGVVKNVVEDSFAQVHREEVKFEFATILLWLVKLASIL